MASTRTSIPNRMIQAFVGQNPYEGSVTGRYFELQIEDVKREHNTYLRVPSPKALRSNLPTSTLAPGPVGTRKRKPAMIRVGGARG